MIRKLSIRELEKLPNFMKLESGEFELKSVYLQAQVLNQSASVSQNEVCGSPVPESWEMLNMHVPGPHPWPIWPESLGVWFKQLYFYKVTPASKSDALISEEYLILTKVKAMKFWWRFYKWLRHFFFLSFVEDIQCKCLTYFNDYWPCI